MSDKKWDVIKTLIIAIAIVVAAFILGNAIDQAGMNIANEISRLANEIGHGLNEIGR